MEKVRCSRVGEDPRMIAYHDEEWGVPEYGLFAVLFNVSAAIALQALNHSRGSGIGVVQIQWL